MNVRKLAPWNWVQDEERNEGRNVPASRTSQEYDNPLAQLHQEIDRIFDDTFRGLSFPSFDLPTGRLNRSGWLKPNVDIAASDKQYTITVEVPGVDENDIKLEQYDDTLVVKGEKKQESEKSEEDFYRVERAYGSFQRVLNLPEDADRDNIDAQFKNGVLTITLPRKAEAKPEGKVININKAA